MIKATCAWHLPGYEHELVEAIWGASPLSALCMLNP
jgi:hypothetical protein